MPDDDRSANERFRRIQCIEIALKIAEINRTAEVQKILSDAKRILSFYEKGPVE
jgi:hypothetical protein